MSLTSHLGRKDDPIRLWIDARFPGIAQVAHDLRRTLPGADAPIIRPPGPVPWSTIGIAFDYRLRYWLAVTPPTELLAYRGAAAYIASRHHAARIVDLDDPSVARTFAARFFAAMPGLVGAIAPVGHQLADDAEATLARICLALALFEEVYRIGPGRSPRLDVVGQNAAPATLLDGIERAWVDDVVALSRAFYRSCAGWLDRPAILNPTFAASRVVGGADGDLVWDGALIEIKTTVNHRFDTSWLRQLLGYVLLDTDDALHIDAVGVYLARQAHLATWPLADILRETSGRSVVPLAAWRADLVEAGRRLQQASADAARARLAAPSPEFTARQRSATPAEADAGGTVVPDLDTYWRRRFERAIEPLVTTTAAGSGWVFSLVDPSTRAWRSLSAPEVAAMLWERVRIGRFSYDLIDDAGARPRPTLHEDFVAAALGRRRKFPHVKLSLALEEVLDDLMLCVGRDTPCWRVEDDVDVGPSDVAFAIAAAIAEQFASETQP